LIIKVKFNSYLDEKLLVELLPVAAVTLLLILPLPEEGLSRLASLD